MLFYFFSISAPTDPKILVLLKALILQIQDDESSVRNEAAEIWSLFETLSQAPDSCNSSVREGVTVGRLAAKSVEFAVSSAVIVTPTMDHLQTMRCHQILRALVCFVGKQLSCLGTYKLILLHLEEKNCLSASLVFIKCFWILYSY